VIVADAGPLIGLGRVGLLDLLRTLYGVVAVPPQVLEELQIEAERPGSAAFRAAWNEGWLVKIELRAEVERGSLPSTLDDGEAAAILLAEQERPAPLLMDERRGRAVARGKELSVLGTGGLLLAAKKQGAIESVRSALDSLLDAGYRMAPSLRDRVLELAGEA
jgi:hypothetical protein